MPTGRLAELAANLNEARQEYRKALAFQQQADKLLHDLMGTLDGTYEFQKADRVSAMATRKYLKALRQFTDFVLGEAQRDLRRVGADCALSKS